MDKSGLKTKFCVNYRKKSNLHDGQEEKLCKHLK